MRGVGLDVQCLIDSGWYNTFIILLFVANFFRERRGFLGINSLGDGVDMVYVPGYGYRVLLCRHRFLLEN